MAQPRRGVVVDPRAVVSLGGREIPLHAFTEVPIQRRRQLDGLHDEEQPEDSEQQNWVQCATCRQWYHWVCALYNQPAHAAAHAKALREAGTCSQFACSIAFLRSKALREAAAASSGGKSGADVEAQESQLESFAQWLEADSTDDEIDPEAGGD